MTVVPSLRRRVKRLALWAACARIAPPLFDAALNPKPVYFAVRDALARPQRIARPIG